MRGFSTYSDSACVAFAGGTIRHQQFYDYYADKKFELDSFLIKTHVPKENRVNIPLVFLIDNYVGSATEDFLINIKNLDLGTIVGEPTAGSCTQPLVVMLPGGGVGMIASQKTMLNKDEVFTFIKPDVLVKRTIEEILAGKDKIYEEGLKVIKQKIINK